jgi:GcrA cell cycle regulator
MNIRVTVSDADIAQAQREQGWTALRTRVAFALFADGMSDSQVACLIGGVTRNAIIGKRHRTGMQLGVGPAFADRPKLKCDNNSRTGQPRPPRTRPSPGPRRDPGLSRLKLDVPPPNIVDAAIPVEQRRSLLELTDSCCHWPVGDPAGADFFFCGAAVQQADAARLQPYCASHSHRAHDLSRSPARRRTAEELVPKLSHARVNNDWRR